MLNVLANKVIYEWNFLSLQINTVFLVFASSERGLSKSLSTPWTILLRKFTFKILCAIARDLESLFRCSVGWRATRRKRKLVIFVYRWRKFGFSITSRLFVCARHFPFLMIIRTENRINKLNVTVTKAFISRP